MSTPFCKKNRKTSWHSLQGRQMPAGNKSTPAVLKTQQGLLQMRKSTCDSPFFGEKPTIKCHSTVTDLARFLGLSMSQPFSFAT